MQHKSPDGVVIRLVRENELPQLLELYLHLHQNDLPLPSSDHISALWKDICRDGNPVHIVVDLDGRLAASCALAVVRNLTRGASPYAIIENVVTHPDFRRRGFGTAVLHHAAQLAQEKGCYKVMLMTGSKRPETLRFYQRAGFQADARTGFVMPLSPIPN